MIVPQERKVRVERLLKPSIQPPRKPSRDTGLDVLVAVSSALVTSAISVPGNEQTSPLGVHGYRETSTGDIEHLEVIGSRLHSQHQGDQRSPTRLSEAAQRQAEEFFSSQLLVDLPQ
jgi:hypothetical protein